MGRVGGLCSWRPELAAFAAIPASTTAARGLAASGLARKRRCLGAAWRTLGLAGASGTATRTCAGMAAAAASAAARVARPVARTSARLGGGRLSIGVGIAVAAR